MKKRYIASFDAGTTAVKGVLADENGTVAAERAVNIPTIFDGGVQEQDPTCWWDAFRAISREFTAQAGAGEIAAIAMSGQMQDLIPLDDRLEPVCNAILYSDGRAEAQAARLEAAVGADRFLHITGNRCDGSLPLPKLMWFKEFRPELYRRTAHVLISSKDYLIARLTGACCGDVTACSSAGAMDIRKICWSPEMLEQPMWSGSCSRRCCCPISLPVPSCRTTTAAICRERRCLPGSATQALPRWPAALSAPDSTISIWGLPAGWRPFPRTFS